MDANKQNIIDFLSNTIDKIEQNTIDNELYKNIGEIYMKHKFTNEFNQRKDSLYEDFSEEEILKFISIGWFIYYVILNKK